MMNYPAPNVKSSEVEKPCMKAMVVKAPVLSGLLVGDGSGPWTRTVCKDTTGNSDTESHPPPHNSEVLLREHSCK